MFKKNAISFNNIDLTQEQQNKNNIFIHLQKRESQEATKYKTTHSSKFRLKQYVNTGISTSYFCKSI